MVRSVAAAVGLLLLVTAVCAVSVLSQSSDHDQPREWLPKCCPVGDHLNGAGLCVASGGNATLADDDGGLLTVTSASATTTEYRLQYRNRSRCSTARFEMNLLSAVSEVVGDSVLLSDGRRLARSEVCADLLPDTSTAVVLICPACDRHLCLHKCCYHDFKMVIADDSSGIEKCEPPDDDDDDHPPWTDALSVVSNKPTLEMHGFPECGQGMYLELLTGRALVTDDGLRPDGDGGGSAALLVPRAHYCADLSNKGLAMLACVLPADNTRHRVFGVLLAVGAVPLVATLALHAWLPELRRSLSSRILLSHVACLLAAYLGLSLVKLMPTPLPLQQLCSFAGFFIQFTILAAIFWLNIMCVDIAWTFSGVRAPKASGSLDSDGHKFLYYSLFAWGGPAAVSAATAFLEYSPLVPTSSSLKPNFGLVTCWFHHWESILLLVYGPMGVLLVANVLMFVYTAVKIQLAQRDSDNMTQHKGSRLNDNKNRFSLYIKLFGLMGISWVFEMVSWAVGGQDSVYWYTTDIFNAFRGFFIFYLFCFNKKVYELIRNKLTGKKKSNNFQTQSRKSVSSSKMSSFSQRTNSIQLSQVT